ncbi:MAG: hypothetical protein R3E12_00740 [Candidatus Eisenbacteria bacterium]
MATLTKKEQAAARRTGGCMHTIGRGGPLRATITGALALTVWWAAVGCSDDDAPTDSVDPNTPFPAEVPDTTTMTVDLTEISSGAFAESGLCHAGAFLAVAWINANVAIRLAIPTAVFAACIQQQPVYLGDETWRWNAQGGAGINAWQAELTGQVVYNEVLTVFWTMRISGTTRRLDRFIWVRGYTQPDGSSGFWTFYDPDRPEGEETLIIDWTRESADHQVLIFQITDAASPQNGDRLTYERAGNDVSVDVFDQSQGGSTHIQWNLSEGSGSFQGLDGGTCCWGPRPDYPDVACP